MNTIISKEQLSGTINRMEVAAPLIARKAGPGQFVVLRLHEKGERIPLSIADFDREKGTITLIFKNVGQTTQHLQEMEIGERILNLAGPLGIPTPITTYGTVLLVGEGVGFTRLYPIARALKQAGNRMITLVGECAEDLPFWKDRMGNYSDDIWLCENCIDFNDGLIEALTQGIQQEKHIDHIWVIGSAEMMRDVAEATRPLGIPTTASLNTIMVDGFGICGSCRVLVDGKTRFACTDGPEFDAHLVDWDGLISRLAFYQRDEATPDHSSSHDCRFENRGQTPAGRGID